MLTSILATILMAGSPAAQAAAKAPSGLAALVGNTIEVRYGDEVMVTSLAADGTFKMKLPDGTRASGDWVGDDRLMCWITRMPKDPPGQNIRCEAVIAGKKIGDTWTQTDTYGQLASVTLLAGDRL